MSVEALENSMIDAIKLELATIGIPSASWRMQTPPAIKEGVPGDKIPGPNLCTIYVQHVTSTPGPDSAGVSLHQLEGTFQLWCCSSHAVDGQRRVLELLADVSDALFGGESAFTEQFPYGSTFGAYSFSGDEAHIKAGVTVGYLEFRLTGDIPDLVEDDMTEEQVRAIVRSMVPQHPFQFPFPIDTSDILTAEPMIDLNMTNSKSLVIFSQPVGTSGIIRNLAWIQSAINPGLVAVDCRLTLEIRYDGNVAADVSIPLWMLAAMEYPEGAYEDLKVSNPIFELTESPRMAQYPGIVTGSSGNFRLPIPFTNGLEIRVVAPAGTDVTNFFSNILWQRGLPDCWNNNLRLFVNRTSEVMAAQVLVTNNMILDDAT